MNTFKAFRVHTIDSEAVCRFENLDLGDLDPGAVTIRVAFSAVNYKDAMAARGVGKNVRTDRPCVTGVDLSGIVISSQDPRFMKGDSVIATNYGLGNTHDGGYSEYARIPADWIVPLPTGLSLYEAMALGTSGLTAALAVDRLEQSGLSPDSGPIAVTGASGGVGCLAVDILAGRGYEVVAISGKPEQIDFLKSIGATRVMHREEFLSRKAPLVTNPEFAGAIDNVGGIMLDRLTAQLRPHGKVAISGMVQIELQSTVLPFVLRSIDILGINVSRQLAMPERLHLWKRLATDLKPRYLNMISRPIEFEKLDQVMDSFFNVSTVGRVVIEINDKAPNR
ncbi:acrylyl-CoA reductase family protein [Candidimonas nitroreducens]|uniref:Oxidoreductase n=1 Tax=Candidimonas nitroreducens TaxID=683354 RepID=A0A225MVV0_9BURK|nr:acryloyl-CoA reductase [Candidimonas nitroreducens]OWT63950.1 oxidoreductase [Candidimonas nitroreducens]